MKKFLFVLAMLVFSTPAFSADPIEINYDDGIYHIILHGEKIKKKIQFVSSESLITNREAHKRAMAKLTINAGFFDPKNEKSISYIVMDRVTAEDPLFNENIMNNSILRRNLDKILNRTEFRIIECNGKELRYEIVPHKTPVDFACIVKTSAQGGPLIYPELKLEEEFFIVKKDGEVVRESASVLHKTARTVIGLKDGEMHILIITDEHPMDMYEVQAYVKKLGLDRAMGFDGGSSTSMNYLDKIEVTSNSDGGGRSLKSFMIVR